MSIDNVTIGDSSEIFFPPEAGENFGELSCEQKNQQGINVIKVAGEANKKIGLVLGRCKGVPIPEEEGWFWVSGNMEDSPEVLTNRVHLQMHFFSNKRMEDLKGLFDRVVVDCSVILQDEDPWNNCNKLLKSLPTAQLIVESSGNCNIHLGDSGVKVDLNNRNFSYPKEFDDREVLESNNLFIGWINEHTKSEIEKKRNQISSPLGGVEISDDAFKSHILDSCFPGRFIARQEGIRITEENLGAHLKSIFDVVEIQKNVPYPTCTDSFLSNFFVLTGPKDRALEFDDLAQVMEYDPLSNTGMTSALAAWAFGTKPEDVTAFLTSVIQHFEKNPKQLKHVLCHPNNAGVTLNEDQVSQGVPRNTPLMLLVKMGGEQALAAVEKILPHYDQEALFSLTPNLNSPLHIAVVTGQFDVAMALMNRAKELEVLDAFLEMQNSSGITADKIMHELVGCKNFHGQYLPFCKPLLGGEEMNKARAVAGDMKELVHLVRGPFIKTARDRLDNRDISPKTIGQYSLKQFFLQLEVLLHK
jgi:hypothetical protein